MSNNFHELKIHEFESFDTRKRILRKKIGGMKLCQKAPSRILNFLYISLYFFPRTIFSSSSRLVPYIDKCMELEMSKHI